MHTTSPAMAQYPWYALQVKARREKQVSALFERKGYETFLPLYESLSRWSDRYKTVQFPLFPGYVFCRIDVNHRLPILMTPGVLRIVSHGAGPTVVEEKQILAFRTVLGATLRCEPCSFVPLGQRVRIASGALSRIEGILTKTHKRHTLVMSVDISHRSVAVEIDQFSVQPVDAPPRSSMLLHCQPPCETTVLTRRRAQSIGE